MPKTSTSQNTNLTSISTLVHAKYIIPVKPENTVLEQHSIAVQDGVILEILPTVTAVAKYESESTFNLEEHAIMPGLINAHGHSPMSLFRGLANDLPLMDWLNDHIWPAETAWVSEAFVRDGSELAIAEMLRGGTTCFSDMYFFPEITAEVATKSGIRTQLVCPILNFPTVWGSGPEEYLSKALQLVIDYSDNQLVQIGLGPHAPYTVSDTPLKNIRNLALEHALPVQIHLHETQNEVLDAIEQSGIRPIERLKNIGLICEEIPLQCVHMTTLDDDDITNIKSSGASVIHCPESNLKLASGFCETAKLLEAGINVAIGTDGAASNNDLDMLGEMRTAALIAKPIARNAAAVDAATAIEMATINGAKALGIDQITGSLESGKAADMIAINLNALNSQPSFDPISDIVYSVSASQVSHTWVNGGLRLENGELVSIDKDALIKKAQEWAKKINTK